MQQAVAVTGESLLFSEASVWPYPPEAREMCSVREKAADDHLGR